MSSGIFAELKSKQVLSTSNGGWLQGEHERRQRSYDPTSSRYSRHEETFANIKTPGRNFPKTDKLE